MDSNRLFVIACAWVVVAGSLLSNGLVHRVLPVFIADHFRAGDLPAWPDRCMDRAQASRGAALMGSPGIKSAAT
jgi:hypothetical protein